MVTNYICIGWNSYELLNLTHFYVSIFYNNGTLRVYKAVWGNKQNTCILFGCMCSYAKVI